MELDFYCLLFIFSVIVFDKNLVFVVVQCSQEKFFWFVDEYVLWLDLVDFFFSFYFLQYGIDFVYYCMVEDIQVIIKLYWFCVIRGVK